jgi:hypothetical protein
MSRDIGNLTPTQIDQLNTALFEQWDAKTQDMKNNMPEPSSVGNVKPSDVSVSFGPVMDERTFSEYQKRKNTRMTVLKAEDLAKMFSQQK